MNSKIEPEALAKMPLLPMRLRVFTDAYHLLSTRRQTGFGINPIALAEIEAYARIMEIDEIEEFVTYMIRMDLAFLMWQQKQGEKTEKPLARRNG